MNNKKVSLLILAALAILLMTASTASAQATRIDYYAIGGDTCDPVFDPPRLSGPNAHFHVTYACHMVGYDMEGNQLSLATGTVYWTDAYLHLVDGQSIGTAKTRFVLDADGGVFEGSFTWPNDTLMGIQHGEGMYKGIHRFATYDAAAGRETGYFLITK
jgi:hypothetical protein